MDFPTAFAIANATATEYHHDLCSHRHGLLCDCHVLTKSPQYLADYGDVCECGCNDPAPVANPGGTGETR